MHAIVQARFYVRGGEMSNAHNHWNHNRAFESALEEELGDSVGQIFTRDIEVCCVE